MLGKYWKTPLRIVEWQNYQLCHIAEITLQSACSHLLQNNTTLHVLFAKSRILCFRAAIFYLYKTLQGSSCISDTSLPVFAAGSACNGFKLSRGVPTIRMLHTASSAPCQITHAVSTYMYDHVSKQSCK